jgi:hypothetical protein
MLVDLPGDGIALWVRDDPLIRILSEGRESQRIAEGVYLSHFNFSLELKAAHLLVSEYPFSPWMNPDTTPHDGGKRHEDTEKFIVETVMDPNTPDDFGVCDHWTQITEKWPVIVDDYEHRYIIALVEIRRDDQEASGGWRWHKWGTYLGTQNPTHEYLYDDTHIDVVYTYHIYEIYA